jgi:hypothetical protein
MLSRYSYFTLITSVKMHVLTVIRLRKNTARQRSMSGSLYWKTKEGSSWPRDKGWRRRLRRLRGEKLARQERKVWLGGRGGETDERRLKECMNIGNWIAGECTEAEILTYGTGHSDSTLDRRWHMAKCVPVKQILKTRATWRIL